MEGMRRICLLVLGALFCVCARAQDVRGTVFEVEKPAAPRAEWKRAPSPGAFAIVHWTGRRPGIGHYESVCIQAAIARTDAQGRFALAEPPPLRSTFLVWRNEPAVAIYKPAFEALREPPAAGAREWLLVPVQRAVAERSALVDRMSDMGCRDENGMPAPLTDPQGVLPAFRAALAAESPPKPPPTIEVRILPRPVPQPAAPR